MKAKKTLKKSLEKNGLCKLEKYLKRMRKLKEKKVKIVINSNHKYGKKLVVKQYELPNGRIENYITTDEVSSVVIFPITTNNEIYLVRQYRPGLDREELELPGGALDQGEDLIEAAKRELREETGLLSNQVVHLGTINYGPYSSGLKHMFIALNCVDSGTQDLDDNEFLCVETYSIDDVKKLIKNAKIRGFDCAYMALDYLKELNFNF